jgi:hypothetical protein
MVKPQKLLCCRFALQQLACGEFEIGASCDWKMMGTGLRFNFVGEWKEDAVPQPARSPLRSFYQEVW